MTSSPASSLWNIGKALAAGLFIAAVAALSAQGNPPSAISAAAHASFEAAILPTRPPAWQRPAPVTWSSRFNVRWEARWSDKGKYMV